MIPETLDTAALAAMCRKHRVCELSLFGSHARGAARPESDIDFLVVFETSARPGFIALARFAGELEELLGRRVDVVSKNGLNPRIRDQVLAEAEVLFAA